MSLFRLVAKLGIDSTEFSAGLKKAESGMQASMSAIGKYVAGAFSVAAITAFVTHVSHAAGEIADLSDQLGITTEEVQKLQKAADHSGVSFDKYASALGKIRKLRADAAAGDKTALGIFERTGINRNASDFSILKSIGGLSDAKAFEILDAKSARLKNSLKELNALTPMELIDDDTLKKLDDAGDKIGDIKRAAVATGAKGTVGTGYAARGLGITIDEFMSSIFGMRSLMDIRNGVSKDGRSNALRINGKTKKQIEKDELDESWRQFLEDPITLGSNIDGPHSTLKDLSKLKSKDGFSRIDMGDRANVGGFFGPNSNLNAKLSKLGSNVDRMTKAIEEVRDTLKAQD